MPIRSLNFTGRKRIRNEEVCISLHEEPGGRILFNAEIELDKAHHFPDDAKVYVEAYRGSSATWMRFLFGTVAALKAPYDRALTDFDSPEGILFRVRVTSVHSDPGLLLGEGNAIHPRVADQGERERESLLPVRSDSSLENQVYRLDFEDGPVLLVNSTLSNWRDIAHDKGFRALVLPEVLKTILTRILVVEKHRYDGDTGDADDDWRNRWIRFASRILHVSDPPDDDGHEGVDTWIEEAVQAFCRLDRTLERFMEYWNRSDA